MGNGKPEQGVGHYVRDCVYGSLDGVITTLAVVAAASGAQMEPRVGIILGLANLVGDGISMGASNYLGLKSELEQTGVPVTHEKPWRHGAMTALAFTLVGAIPLLAYFIPWPFGVSVLGGAGLLAALSLSAAGALRARFVEKPLWLSAAEMVAVGFGASLAAWLVGVGAARLIR